MSCGWKLENHEIFLLRSEKKYTEGAMVKRGRRNRSHKYKRGFDLSEQKVTKNLQASNNVVN